ncbi:MAG: SUMF1/EgtB/PvdO family nonheme iron enzyme [Nitrospira sp.]|nr:SUMF1/EgtB/PvdO family nonheme iron enzyme [Nitrospira sp.]
MAGVHPAIRGRSFFVIRGGSWNNEPDNVRSANRNRNTPTKRNDNIGFRCAQDACPMAGVRIFMGKARSVPLGVQIDPGLIGAVANSRRMHRLHFGPVK